MILNDAENSKWALLDANDFKMIFWFYDQLMDDTCMFSHLPVNLLVVRGVSTVCAVANSETKTGRPSVGVTRRRASLSEIKK